MASSYLKVRERKQRVIERITNNVKEKRKKLGIQLKVGGSNHPGILLLYLLKQIIIYIDSALEYNKKYVSEVRRLLTLIFKQKIEDGEISKFDIHDIIEYILDTFIELTKSTRQQQS